MPKVTQTRKTTAQPWASKPTSSGSWIAGDSADLYVSPRGMQSTTSFRTGADLDELDVLHDFGSTRSEFYQGLREEQRSGPQSSYDNGHEFDSSSQVLDAPSVVQFDTPKNFNGYQGQYKGPLLVDPSYIVGGTFPGVPNTTQLSYYGPAAIQRTIPTSPHVSLAQGLTELKREGIPALVGAAALAGRVAHFRELGGEYLNLEFGWKPLLSDIQGTYSSVTQAAKLLRQYQRDSGKIVRRKTSFQPITTFEVLQKDAFGTLLKFPGWSTASWNAAFEGGSSGSGLMTTTRKTTISTWFSGAYTYFLQSDNTTLNRMFGFEQKANLLFGTRVTPDVVWNLAPWSWLSDWYVNIGDNIANASALSADGLVMKYGYLMQETVIEVTVTYHGPRLINGQSSGTVVQSFTTRRKTRTKASPYGFGSNPASFTSRQWAILTALGFARGSGQLALGD